MSDIEKIINEAWENRDNVNQDSEQSLKDTINQMIADLDSGKVRVAEKINGEWVTHQHIKKAIMLSFRIYPMENLNGPYSSWYDKAHLLKGKTAGWTKEDHEKAGFRMVPNSPVRKGSFVGKNAVLMPCYVNIGAYIGKGTMVDTWATVGSCAQIGENVHISGGVGIGGVLEPVQASPVIIEDNVFLSSRSIIVEGVIIRKEAVLGANVVLTASTKIIDVTNSVSKEIKGEIPARSVVIPGTVPKKFKAGTYNVPCALIIGKRKESTDKKTSLNQVLREHNLAV